MEHYDYLLILRKRWMSVLLITGLAIAGAVAGTLLTTPTYQAESQVFVSVSTGGSTSDLLQGSSFTQSRVKSYTDLVAAPRVLIPVIARLGLATTPAQLATSITADTPPDTVLINITVTNTNPQLASDIANATADSLGTQVTALEKTSDTQPSPVHISSTKMATVPIVRATPNVTLNLALGTLLGLSVGFLLAVLREVLDTKVRSEDDVQRITDASVIARIGYDNDAPQHPLIVQSSPQSHRSEAFRRLRTNLQFLDMADGPKVIVVTSSLPGEGKSTTAVNLAITMADAGSRVALIDADLRRPSIAEYMGLEGEVGLTTVLIGQADVRDAIQPWGDRNLDVLTSGQIPPNPSELLGSRAMASLLEQLAGQYDMVLIDTPPLLPVTDAAILAKIAGGAVVVAAADVLHRQQLADGLGSLEDVGARVLGVVLNRLASKQADAYSYYAYVSSPGTKARGKGHRTGTGTSDPTQRPTTSAVAPRSLTATATSPGADIDRHPVRASTPPEDNPQTLSRSLRPSGQSSGCRPVQPLPPGEPEPSQVP